MPFEQQREEAERIRGDARYVGRIPVLVERAERALALTIIMLPEVA